MFRRPCPRLLALLTVALLGSAPLAQAQVHSRCAAAKKACITKKVKALLACHSAADKKGVAVDPACLAKARARFDGGATPDKGCFAKLEAKQKAGKPLTICPSVGDTALLESDVDAFVDRVVCRLGGGCSGEDCDSAQLITAGNFTAQTTAGFQFDYDACGLPGGFDGPDRVYTVVVPAGATLTVSATPVPGSDGVGLALFEGAGNCGSTQANNCAADDTPSATETVQVAATNNGAAPVAFFILAGAPGVDAVTFEMTVTITN
jgi:hypothetical protein